MYILFVCVYVYMIKSVHTVQRHWIPLKLELQVIVSYLS